MIKTLTFDFTGAVQTYIIPYDGFYNLECFGAQGGGNGGHGGYSKGIINFKKGQTIYIYVGGQGNDGYGGFNGGGNGGIISSIYRAGYGGGGASDIRVNGQSMSNRIIVAGGGGGNGGGNAAKLGGDSGGLIGIKGQDLGGSFVGGNPGTQTAGGTKVCWDDSTAGYLGQGGIGGSTAGGTQNLGGGGGGGGYYGGGGGSYYNASDASKSGSGGGGGSSYITGLIKPLTTAGVKTGNGQVLITYLGDGNAYFLSRNDKYYITNSVYFNEKTKEFIPVTLAQIVNEIKNNDEICILLNINDPFSVVSIDDKGNTITTNYIPSELIDFSQYKLCAMSLNNLYKITINYTPSSIALSKTNIKIKNKYTPLTDELKSTFLDITATDKSKIDYFLDYGEDKSYKSCSILNKDIISNDFYANFKLNSDDSLLQSITLCGKNNDKYTKLKNTSIDIYDNLKDKKFITFNSDYDEVIINKLSKQSLDYTIDSLDKF